MKNDLNYAVELIRRANGILITAGAGMSVDSGLPDFRSVGGLWNAYPPLEKFGLSFSEIATPKIYLEQPELAYWFFAHRLKSYRETPAHQGYHILKRWAEQMEHGYFVFTSNVDGHFQQAGFDDERIYEVHGSLHRMQCFYNCQDKTWRSDNFQPEVDNEKCLLLSEKPTCPDCHGMARQNVMMFDDYLYCDHFYETKLEALQKWLKQVERLVVIELGAGKSIPTVRRFSERTVKQKKGGFIRINPLDAGVPKMHFLSLEMKALDALVAIDEQLNKRSD